jgi:hypothetical protein
LAAVVLAALVLVLQPSSALASGGLASVTLKTALPGFVLSSPGTDNGPIDNATLNSIFANEPASQRAQLSKLLSSGQLSGYVRVWRSRPLIGDGLVIFVFRSPSQYAVSTMLGGFEKAGAQQVSVGVGKTFAVPGVADAMGYNLYLTNQNPPLREFLVSFAKGNTVYLMTLVTSKYDLTEANAISLAQRQSALAPGTALAPQTPPSVAEDLLFGVIAALVVAIIGALWQRQRTRKLIRDNPAVDVTRYATYKHLARDQRKIARRSLVKLRVNADEHLNDAALAWADHNVIVYWIVLASFVALDLTTFVVSQGHVYVISFLAIAMFIGALNLRRKRGRFIELRGKYSGLGAAHAAPSGESTPTLG